MVCVLLKTDLKSSDFVQRVPVVFSSTSGFHYNLENSIPPLHSCWGEKEVGVKASDLVTCVPVVFSSSSGFRYNLELFIIFTPR